MPSKKVRAQNKRHLRRPQEHRERDVLDTDTFAEAMVKKRHTIEVMLDNYKLQGEFKRATALKNSVLAMFKKNGCSSREEAEKNGKLTYYEAIMPILDLLREVEDVSLCSRPRVCYKKAPKR